MYQYKDCSQEPNIVPNRMSPKKEDKKRISPNKLDGSPRGWRTEVGSSTSCSSKNSYKGSPSSNTPEKVVKSANTTSSSRLPSRPGFNGSPINLFQPSGSVLSKASMFEAKNADTKAKDPAQMTLAERMALFERNKGEPPLIPKAPLTMSIPPKKLQEKDKFNVKSGSNAGMYICIVSR